MAVASSEMIDLREVISEDWMPVMDGATGMGCGPGLVVLVGRLIDWR